MEAALSCVFSKIGELVQEVVLPMRLKCQIDLLKLDLEIIRGSLRDAVTIRKNDEEKILWGKVLVLVAYETEDAIDTFLYEIRQTRGNGASVLKKFAQKPIKLYAEHKLHNSISVIQAKLLAISHLRVGLTLREEENEVMLGEEGREQRLLMEGSASDYYNDEIVGFDDAKRNLIDLMVTDKSGQRRHVVSIAGMGGIGKTTLAQMVYNSKEVKEYFEIAIWLTISSNFNLVDILNKGLDEIGIFVPREWQNNVDLLFEEMDKVLRERKYLVVLDDVWELEDCQVLFDNALPDVGNGSRVLMTTRLLYIARRADPYSIAYELLPLSEEDSLKLLLAKAFPYENATSGYFYYEVDVAKELSKRCCGIPLTLVAVGGLLSSRDKTYASWNHVLQTLDKQYCGGDLHMHILVISYDYLPYYLKPCFLYFACFPKNCLIDANSLKRMWIADGFVQSDEKLSLEDASENYLEELAQRCLVQVSERSVYGTIKLCRVHDILHDLAISKAKEEQFLQVNPLRNVRVNFPARRAAHFREDVVQFCANNNLRSLFVFNVNIPRKVGFRFLRVLELQQVRNHNNLPIEVTSMFHLRYLGLRGSRICALPKKIDRLQNLQTLDIRLTDLASVPVSLWNITTLRHILSSKPINGPPKQSILNHLQTLKDVEVMDWKKGLPCMENIRKLGLWNSKERDSDPTTMLLQNLKKLLSLSINWQVLPEKIVDMRHFCSYGLIQSLKLQGEWPQNLPLDAAMFPSHISKLVLDNTRLEQDPMPELRRLQTIKVLYLRCEAIICKKIVCFNGGFLQLEKLHLLSIHSLEEFYVEEGSLPVLKFLCIKDCKELRMLPDLHYVTTLQELELVSVSEELLQRTTKQDGLDWHKIKHITSFKQQYTSMSLGRKKVPIWTPNEIILFEMALAKYDKETPDRWHDIASMMGGNKSAEEVKRHYELHMAYTKNVEGNAGKFTGKDAAFMVNRQKGKMSCEQSGKEPAHEWDIQSVPPNGAISFMGRENDKESIIELLMQRDAEECNSCFVVSIIGELGIGKTTVARAVYNDSRVLDTFDIRIFVSMSQSYDEKQLMKAIIEAITQTSCEMTEPDMLETTIKEEFSGKRFLIVLDDAACENKGSLNVLSLLNIATSENMGSAVLIATSSIAIANDVMGAKKVYNLNPLSESCCFEIIKRIAFERKDPNDVDGFVWICKELVTRSGYNPLCLKVLGGLLKSLNHEKWIEVLESDCWRKNKFDGDIFHALRVCYDYLPTPLKRCFSYFSLFPKNYVFKKDEVIRLWLSQGFIEPKEGREPEDIGNEYFDELSGRFFIEESINNAEGEKFVMHGQIHGLAKHVSINEYLSSEDYMQRIPENTRHFSFVPSEFQNLPIKHMVAEATDLQSFLVLNRCSWNPISPITNLVDLSDLILTLSLSNTAIEELPDAVGLLGNLLYLGLNNTGIKSLPPKMSSLTNLRTLEAANCYSLGELPGSIKELINLRHLDVRKEWEHVRMPVGIGSLCNLRSLPAFNVGSDLSESAIGELKSLELLRGSLQISGLENVASALDAKVANLAGKLYLEKLSLQWSPSIDYIMEENCEDVVEMVLENLQPCYNLHELVIRNYMGSKFPTWMGDVLYSKLESVVLDNCPSCDLFPALGNLPLLKYLSVQKLYGVREMRGLGKFPSLELLNLWEMYDLEVFELKVGDFPCIHTLSINRCHKLKSVPCTPSLVHLSLHFCLRLPEFPELPSLEFLKIESFKEIEVLHLPTNLPVLKNLEIVDCGELRSLGDISQLKSIEKLKIFKCQKLDLNISWGRRHLKKESSRGICINLFSATSTVGGAMLEVQKGDITVSSASGSNDVILKVPTKDTNFSSSLRRPPQPIKVHPACPGRSRCKIQSCCCNLPSSIHNSLSFSEKSGFNKATSFLSKENKATNSIEDEIV